MHNTGESNYADTMFNDGDEEGLRTEEKQQFMWQSDSDLEDEQIQWKKHESKQAAKAHADQRELVRKKKLTMKERHARAMGVSRA